MIILGIETTSLFASIALFKDGDIVAELVLEQNCKHSRYILPAINNILNISGMNLSDIKIVAVGIGPGSFTGIRVGLSIAKGLAVENDIGISGISSMENIACKIDSAKDIYAVISAHRQEFYIQKFKKKSIHNVCPESECFILKKDEIRDFFENKNCVICGYGINKPEFAELNDKAVQYLVYPTAGYATVIAYQKYLLGHTVPAIPAYILRIGAEVKGAKIYKF